MPNWCEGTLRVRGKAVDLRRFITEVLGGIDTDCNVLGFYEYAYDGGLKYIEGTHRCFVEYEYIYFEAKSDDEIRVIAVNYKQAWDIQAAPLVELCARYGLDMRIHAFECGMCFERVIEIIGGKLTIYAELRHEDYEWDCICPMVGG